MNKNNPYCIKCNVLKEEIRRKRNKLKLHRQLAHDADPLGHRGNTTWLKKWTNKPLYTTEYIDILWKRKSKKYT